MFRDALYECPKCFCMCAEFSYGDHVATHFQMIDPAALQGEFVLWLVKRRNEAEERRKAGKRRKLDG